MIELKHLSKTFRTKDKEITALEDINLTINDGEIFGIIGLSGAGKSTLVRCINLLERPTAGEVIIDGKSIGELPERELLKLRQSIGMIFQDFALLEQRNVLDNVCFPMEIAGKSKAKARERAKELLARVGLTERSTSYPSQLSGGQKQRVAIARALAMDPKYILCDEATSALDPTTTRSILELLKDINRDLGVTGVVITHEMKVRDQICDRVAIIDKSHIAEEGKVSDVFTNPQSTIGRELILPSDRTDALEALGGEKIRIIFDGQEAGEPVISRMVLESQVPVSIIFADTREVGDVTYGHMVVGLPKDPRQAAKIKAWLEQSTVDWRVEKEEVI